MSSPSSQQKKKGETKKKGKSKSTFQAEGGGRAVKVEMPHGEKKEKGNFLATFFGLGRRGGEKKEKGGGAVGEISDLGDGSTTCEKENREDGSRI